MHEFFISPLNTLFREGTIATRVSGTLLAAAAVTAAALMIVTLINSDTTAEAVASVVTTLTTVIAVAAASAISAYVKFVTKNYQGMTLKEITQWDLSHAGFHTKENKAGIIALVIHIAVTWAAWGISWAVNNLQFGSMAWDNSLATTIAATITAIVMFVLLATVPFGKVIAAVIAVVDALAATGLRLPGCHGLQRHLRQRARQESPDPGSLEPPDGNLRWEDAQDLRERRRERVQGGNTARRGHLHQRRADRDRRQGGDEHLRVLHGPV
jgi:hypothetical protein